MEDYRHSYIESIGLAGCRGAYTCNLDWPKTLLNGIFVVSMATHTVCCWRHCCCSQPTNYRIRKLRSADGNVCLVSGSHPNAPPGVFLYTFQCWSLCLSVLLNGCIVGEVSHSSDLSLSAWLSLQSLSLCFRPFSQASNEAHPFHHHQKTSLEGIWVTFQHVLKKRSTVGSAHGKKVHPIYISTDNVSCAWKSLYIHNGRQRW